MEAAQITGGNQQWHKLLFEAVFQHATMGILITNKEGKIILVNQFALNEFGYESSDLIGKPIEKLIPQRFHATHRHDRTGYNHHPETRAMGAGRDLYGLKKDGSEFPVEVSLSPYKAEDELLVIAFLIDISIRKEKEKAEEGYRAAMVSLEKQKELNDMKSRFVTMASHEFKTPLSTILSSASLISKYTSSEDQSKREKHIERIKSAVSNLNGILNEFLSIGKMEQGSIGSHPDEFLLDELISSVCMEMIAVQKKTQKLEYAHHGIKTAYLDEGLLRNVLINLISNAIKFSPEDGKVFVSSFNNGKEITISVKDNGVGISGEDQQHLFDLFFRGKNVTNIPGTGLGLYIVQKYIELLKGTISFESQVNAGTEFILTFKQGNTSKEE